MIRGYDDESPQARADRLSWQPIPGNLHGARGARLRRASPRARRDGLEILARETRRIQGVAAAEVSVTLRDVQAVARQIRRDNLLHAIDVVGDVSMFRAKHFGMRERTLVSIGNELVREGVCVWDGPFLRRKPHPKLELVPLPSTTGGMQR